MRSVLISLDSCWPVFVGIATKVCVESKLRDGCHLAYRGVMLEDATHHLGPQAMQEASAYNVGKFFGWVSPSTWRPDWPSRVRRKPSMPMTFDDFIGGLEAFGARIQPLMTCRTGVRPG